MPDVIANKLDHLLILTSGTEQYLITCTNKKYKFLLTTTLTISRHIATGLVSILKAHILKKGIVPYYGTSFSNLASQHVAAKAGFEVAWVELITERMEY